MSLSRRLLPVLLASLALPALAQHGPAAETRAGALVIRQPWSRAAPAQGTGAGFMTLGNTGATADRLLSASSPAARRVELHTHIRDGEVMRMRAVPNIEIPAGQAVELRPGGFHVMLIGLTAALAQGTEVPLTLRFEQAGEVQVMLSVQGAGARGPMMHHH